MPLKPAPPDQVPSPKISHSSGGFQSLVIVGNDQTGPAQAAIGERAQDFVPEDLCLAGLDGDAQNLAAAIQVDRHGHYGRDADDPTAATHLDVGGEGENLIVLDPGANARIPDEVVAQAIGQCAAGDWLLIQNETNQAGDCARLARAHGMRVALSVAPFVAEVVVPLLDTVDLPSLTRWSCNSWSRRSGERTGCPPG